MSELTTIYPSGFYRVSLKAIIRNKKDEVLMVKEKSSSWCLPGGGIDHNEEYDEALRRELYEEALITQPFTAYAVGIDTFYVREKEAWLMWVVYEVSFNEPLLYGIGQDATDVAFIDPKILKDSMLRAERLTYRWCVDRSASLIV
ncbi:MAG TPA: NUDIX hydrolase [Candidatus Saccharimonadales bacterium]|nr:NUDIX hydrolase [Candidatus Saccharimonadales bacterium]